jgi:membrane fusion protein (multidrug efflux system)
MKTVSDETMNSEEKRAASDEKGESKKPRRRWLRFGLLVFGPLALLLAGAYVYMNSGRYVETDDAYVKAATVAVSAQVAGPIAKIAVTENQHVHKGDVLFEIDDDAYRVAVKRARAQLDTVDSMLLGLAASYQQEVEKLNLARTNAAYTKKEYERKHALLKQNLSSAADVDEAQNDYDVARQQIPIIEQALAQLRAQLGGDVTRRPEDHSAYQTAKANLDSAQLDLEHTVVRAPFDGIASKVPEPGAYVTPGNPVMGLVSDKTIWIEANYKETELTHVEPGQAVEIRIDTYPGHEWHGRVESIAQATGAEFSVIPAQNATGNWVKVTQRIPVRIAIESGQNDPPLRAGMSAVIDIDTRHVRTVPKLLGFLVRKPKPLPQPFATMD